jgi:UDP-N-acetylmuramoyl-L-alanyl-D-glutamate--2,6-diaminopimelate ligase
MMTGSELLHMIQPQQHTGSYSGPIGRLRLDSRNVRKNDVFIALRGTVSDGHRFIRDAVRKGARVVICEHLPDDVPGEVLCMQVADTRSILGYLAQALTGSPARAMKMVGVTGTNGKTTVCTLVYQVLRKLGYNAGLLGTVETRIGDRITESRLTTPDAVSLAESLEQMAAVDTAFAIMEVSSHALEQQRVNGIRFEVAAFTNISQDHLDYHRDMDSYIDAKKRLFTMLDDRAVAVVNRDDPASFKVTDGCRADIWDFSFREDRDFRILDEGPDGLVLDLDGAIVSTPLTGRYNAWNVAQAYLICLALGLTKNSVAAALGEAQGAPGRLERVMPHAEAAIHQISAPKVFVDYAHTPDALENVLQALAAVRGEGDTLHVVFGAGGDRDQSKRPAMGRIADRHADVVTLTSDNPRTEDPDAIIRDIRKGLARSDKLFVEASRRKAIRSAILEADTRTMVLVAGKGHERYQEVHGRRNKFDDREVAAKALTEWIERRVHKKGRRSGKTSKNTKEVN